jgi:arginine exporter protein ArgO
MIALLVWLTGSAVLSYEMWRHGLFAWMGTAALSIMWFLWVLGGAAALGSRLSARQGRSAENSAMVRAAVDHDKRERAAASAKGAAQ